MRLLLLLGIVPLLLAAAPPPVDDARAALLEQRREKLKQKWEQQFRTADADASGGLSREEALKAGLPRSLTDHFDEIDLDRDGVLTPEELLQAHERRLVAQRAAQTATRHP